MGGLARWCFRHAGLVVLAWIALVVALVAMGRVAGKDYTEGFSLPGTGSSQAQGLLASAGERPGSGDDTIVFHALVPGARLTDPDLSAAITAALVRAEHQPGVASIASPLASGHGAQISSDGRTGYAQVRFDKADTSLARADIDPLVSSVSSARSPALEVEYGGGAFQSLKGSPVSGSIAIGLLAAAVILLLAFGSAPAALIPLTAAILSVASGIEAVGLLSHRLSVNAITPSIAALIGTGVAVDYALFVVTRHRQDLLGGSTVETSAVRAVATSGRAVVLAGSTVVVAMLALLVLRVDFLTGVGVAAALTVAFGVLAAVTLLPAMFKILGMRVLSRRERRRLTADDHDPERPNAWSRWAELVQRRPALLGGSAVALMAILVVPAFSLRLGASDQGNDPSASTTRKAYDLLASGFGPGSNGPLLVVAKPQDAAARVAFRALVEAISQSPGVASAHLAPSTPENPVRVLDVIPTSSPQSAQTQSLLQTLRTSVIPGAEAHSTLRAYVGGQTAVFQDFADVLGAKLPLFVSVIVLVGGLLMLLAFRSLMVPLVAAVMNILAAAASFGVVVAIFQWGWGSEALGLGRAGPIESFLPVMLLAILFGLSMDYQVFLVSRMHEEWTRTGDTALAVRRGQQATGRVITAAAAIMVCVFSAFALEGRRPIGEFGLGLAAAILLDALVLRTVLVPAAMHLLGRWNWWLPSGLDRVLPHLPVDEGDRPSPKTASPSGQPADQRGLAT
ncbi:MAG TPA: MMPL family transporter [Nocardioides sp.]|uniref:MMPL family transporter n=1 Tax=Nocardioides sp. TaxID=35761 RepID=UPI002E360F08|nr:MMPL family transporter [Nocardioides sp.]HEX3930831.1 MMPL family transporter [Nocardioides sp.]